MDAPSEMKEGAGLSDYLAAERTLLAWIRTGLALMGFGFVVARFGLFLQQMQSIQHSGAVQTYGLSLWFGTALIAAGVAVNLFSGWHHYQLVRAMELGRVARPHSMGLALATALFLALVGIAMAIYLISVRDSARTNTGNGEERFMTPDANNGIQSKRSNHSVDETLERLKRMLEAKGVTIFAIVDHSGEAEKAGLKMPPTKLVVFGSPKAGTPLMLASPSAAIDLPLKILISEDAEARVWISYNSPSYLQERHGFPKELLQNISVAETLAAKAAE
jgi:uncharacterized protein (DUF302 family)/uncharacterized membrane protein YidH (DUF202 family)